MRRWKGLSVDGTAVIVADAAEGANPNGAPSLGGACATVTEVWDNLAPSARGCTVDRDVPLAVCRQRDRFSVLARTNPRTSEQALEPLHDSRQQSGSPIPLLLTPGAVPLVVVRHWHSNSLAGLQRLSSRQRQRHPPPEDQEHAPEIIAMEWRPRP
jgi:hypothetical protein